VIEKSRQRNLPVELKWKMQQVLAEKRARVEDWRLVVDGR